MIKQFFTLLFVCISTVVVAQQATSSPYSFFGIGSPSFKGTVENRSMGGISMYSDSIHLNLQNPSGLAKLKLVTFSIGATNKYVNQKSSTESGSTSTSAINYIALGLPVSDRLAFSFGILPLSNVGYNIETPQDEIDIYNRGIGGVNKVFVGMGYSLNKNVSLGLDLNYNFGNITTEALYFNPMVEFATRETNRSELAGFSATLGATYKTMLTDRLELMSAVTYIPKTKLDSENSRQIASVLIPNDNLEIDIDVRNIEIQDSSITLPYEFTVGVGLGQQKKWFVGAEFTTQGKGNFPNNLYTIENVEYSNLNRYKIGGFYTPNHTSFSSYFNRVTYRAGMRYEDTGLRVNNENINEFGITFGVGLPVGRMFSNFNLGFEIGSRGTTNSGLIKENFFNTIISLSLNDRWFTRALFD